MTARLLCGTLVVLLIVVCTFHEIKGANVPPRLGPPQSTLQPRKALVVASLISDDVSWLATHLPDWEHNDYVMDDEHAPLTVAKNKGRESTAYLTYIIDNYDDLPDYTVFLHGLRYQWHNEDPMYDGVPMLRRLRLSYVDEEGYVNLRCSWTLGCPSELHDMHPNVSAVPQTMDSAFLPAIAHLFPEVPPPSEVGVGCGAQFALSRTHVRKRPVEDYERVRNWLWKTDLDDAISGRILEYSWHMMMGKPAVHCPSADQCFCDKYGLCDLDCKGPSDCGRFMLPKYATIPKGWPNSGEEGQNGWPARDWWL